MDSQLEALFHTSGQEPVSGLTQVPAAGKALCSNVLQS